MHEVLEQIPKYSIGLSLSGIAIIHMLRYRFSFLYRKKLNQNSEIGRAEEAHDKGD